MPKPNGKGFRLSAMREQRAKALGGQYVEIEDDDGNVIVRIPRASFWDAKTYEDITTSGQVVGDMETLERIMDPDEFAKLQDLGLQLGDMRELIVEVMRDVDTDPESKGSSTR